MSREGSVDSKREEATQVACVGRRTPYSHLRPSGLSPTDMCLFDPTTDLHFHPRALFSSRTAFTTTSSLDDHRSSFTRKALCRPGLVFRSPDSIPRSANLRFREGC